MGFQYVKRGFDYTTMTMTVEFVEVSLRVSNQLHHAGQILVFIVTSVEFQFPVAADEHQWWTVFAHPIDGSVFVDGNL